MTNQLQAYYFIENSLISDKNSAIILYICFVSVFGSAEAFAAVWFLQGLAQGGVWPAAAKIFKQVRPN